jgi:hypothetical protein
MVKRFITILLFSAFFARADISGTWVYDLILSTDSGVPNTAGVVGYTGSEEAVYIPTSINDIPVTRIGLPILVFPDSETGIGGSAFSTSAGVKSISIPSTITEIGRRAFFSCSDLTSIDVAPDNPYYSSQEGVLYNKNKTTLVAFPSGKAGTFSIPSSVTSINNEAFKGCSKLTAVTIPESVTSIGYEAFANCSSLSGVSLPNNIETIHYGTFARCTALASVTLPNNVHAIWGHSFLDCISLTNITFSQSLLYFDGRSFNGCTGLSKACFLGSRPSRVTMTVPDGIPTVATDMVNWANINWLMGFSSNTKIFYKLGAVGWSVVYPAATPIEVIPPKIKDLSFIEVDGIRKIRLTLETLPEGGYTVEKSTDLVSWHIVTTLFGDGKEKSIEEISSDRAFYRVILYYGSLGQQD